MAELQLPSFCQGDFRTAAMSQRVTAPEKIRTKIKVAGSMRVCLRADRQSREFPAKAIMVRRVRVKRRAGFTARRLSRRQKTENEKPWRASAMLPVVTALCRRVPSRAIDSGRK